MDGTAVAVWGITLLVVLKVGSYLIKSEIFWIALALTAMGYFFGDKDKSTTVSKPEEPVAQTVSSSGEKYLEEGGLFCLTESAHDRQYEMLAAGIKKFDPQCFTAARDIRVELVDFQMLGGVAKVIGVESGNEMWTTSEQLITK